MDLFKELYATLRLFLLDVNNSAGKRSEPK